MSLPEDLKAELERALEEAKTDAPYYSVTEIVREQVQPILERLVAALKYKDQIEAVSPSYEELLRKLAASEAERDHWAQCCNEWAETATKHACTIMEQEALLGRRPHLFLQEGLGVREVEEQGTLHNPKECARLGGACAK